MINKKIYDEIKMKALSALAQANIILTEAEKDKIEIADFGLNNIYDTGLQLITYINTERVCAKEMVLLPNQACPEHLHPPFGDYQGKEETFRCRQGLVYLYVEGKSTNNISLTLPKEGQQYYTVFKEIKLAPGDQYTIPINTKHWFKAGPDGAIVSEFSTPSFDEEDVFTNPSIIRVPRIDEEDHV